MIDASYACREADNGSGVVESLGGVFKVDVIAMRMIGDTRNNPINTLNIDVRRMNSK
jgi:hypothetical protein